MPTSCVNTPFTLSKVADDGQGTDHDSFVSFLSITCESRPAMSMFLVADFTITDKTAEEIEASISDISAIANGGEQVYDANGRLLSNGQHVSLSGMRPGIYVVKSGAGVKKVIVK